MSAVTQTSSKRCIAYVSLLFQGIAALCFHGLTLCIGADGHTALAWMAADDCCPQTQSAAIRAGDCCDCTDAPLLQPLADKRAAGDELVWSSASPSPIWFVLATPQTVPPADYGLPPPDSLTARHSVVLQA